MKKQISEAFGKTIYLLGKDKDGKKHWLEEPSWDCGWYWGFGYIHTYTNNRNPSISKDIQSHSHWSSYVGEQEKYDFDKRCFVKGDFVYHINEFPEFVETVLTKHESWMISDLMKRFYTLREMSDILTHGTGHLVSDDTLYKTINPAFLSWINNEELPELFKAVLNLLTPEDKEE
jgi:hypothetical protein